MAVRRSAQLSSATHAKLKQYAQLTNQTINAVTTEIVDDWMDTVGEARIEALVEKAHSDNNVVDISSRLAFFSSPATC